MGDTNFNVNVNVSSSLDYLHVLQSNAFLNLITIPTRVTPTSRTVIDHILTNDNESTIIPKVLTYSISDHLPISCEIFHPNVKAAAIKKSYSFRNLKSVDRNEFCNDLEHVLTPLVTDFLASNVTSYNFDHQFNKLISAITNVIDKHAPIQTASRRQKRILRNPWLTKRLLISIKNKQKLYLVFSMGASLTNFFIKHMPTN